MAGKLYLCATPIGNLEDITYRVVRTLNEVDLIGAEDTRNSIKLLNHFDIKTPMTSYHEFNKYDKAKQLVEMMKEGKNIAIITDAGTPGISDPGEEVVRQCFEAGIQVTSLPGPAACITALTMSGQKTRRFCFEAFLPKDKKEKVAVLEELKNETRTIIIYEAPHRLARTLKELRETLGNRQLTLCRELTKKYEEADKTTIDQAIEKYNGTVLMVSHDFYTVANCMDYVLLTEDKGLRKVSMRKFRKMIYADHFDKDYLEYEQKKKELENRIAFALQAGKYEDAKKISEELEKLLRKYNG